MKKQLIDKLYDEFEKDKEVIKRNLLEVMDCIVLETRDKYGKIKMTIKYERKGENENE